MNIHCDDYCQEGVYAVPQASKNKARCKKKGQTRCGSSTLENEKTSIQFFVHAIAGRQIVDEGLCFVLIELAKGHGDTQ